MGRLWETVNGKRKRTKAGLRHQYEKWDGTKEGKAKRAARNNARRSALRSGRAHKGDGTDVHHANGINSKSGLRVMSSSKNRGISEKSRRKGSKRNTARWGR